MTLIGYARVSTNDQDVALQLDALRDAGVTQVFEDRGVSGAKSERRGLNEALAYLREGGHPGRVKARSPGPVYDASPHHRHRSEANGIGFRSLTKNIDTNTPTGRLVFHILGALGQFERDLIRERTSAGIKAAAARGRKGGRPVAATPGKVARARQLIEGGLTVREAAARMKVSKSALYAALASGREA